jgi:hypothetical protein
LRVYQLNIGITSVPNKVFFSARFYCALLTLHVSAPFGGHLQVVHKHKTFINQQLLYHFIFFILHFYSILYFFRVCCFSAVGICCITTIFAYTCLLNGSVEYMMTTLDFFVFVTDLSILRSLYVHSPAEKSDDF